MIKRIVIMGCPGSGKSTLARALGDRLGLPVYHLDALFWQPKWVESDYEEFAPRVQVLLTQDQWIVDGGYRNADPDEVRFREVDAFIYYNRPVWVCRWRVLKRVIQYRNRTRPDMGEGCPEKVDLEFLHYIWTYPRKKRPIIEGMLERNATPVIYLTKDPDVDDLITEISLVASARTSRANP